MQIYLLLIRSIVIHLWTKCRECFGFFVRTRKYFVTELRNKTVWNILDNTIRPNKVYSDTNKGAVRKEIILTSVGVNCGHI